MGTLFLSRDKCLEYLPSHTLTKVFVKLGTDSLIGQERQEGHPACKKLGFGLLVVMI